MKIVITGSLVHISKPLSGILFEDYYKNKPVMSKTKMADFAKEFASAYNREK